jgi:asparagine synthase (glutamine-hydrolysing)
LTVTADGTSTLERHWFFPQPAPLRRAEAGDIVAGYRAVLRAAVDDRIGRGRATIFLSGGIDSTTIAAAATDRTRLRAVTVEYARTPQNRDPALARLAAGRLSIPIDVIPGDRFEALDDGGDDRVPPLPIDEPTVADWRTMLRCAARDTTIGLYGEDGDALFTSPGGLELVRAQGAASLVGASARYVARTRALPYYGLRLRERLGIAARQMAPIPAWLSKAARRLSSVPAAATVLGRSPEPLPPHPTRTGMQQRLLRDVPNDFAVTLATDVFRERLELRLPLMDSRVLAYVATVPPIPWCQRKHLARAAFRDDLPADVITRRKTPVHGFYEAFVETWRRRRLSQPLLDLGRSPLGDWVDAQAWADTLRRGAPLDVVAAWRVLLLDRWLKACTR